jgi:uncharacterized repeat protein (TIGR01451 family)
MMEGRSALLLFTVLIGTWGSVLAQGTRPEVTTLPGAYGYVVVDHEDPRCTFDFADISVGGDAVWFTASDSSPADDDGGAVIALDGPFELYGVAVPGFVMSTNGYIASASSLAVEGGGDFSDDPALPSIPDNAPATPARLFVYHTDLSGLDSGGAAYTQFFADCPRPSEALGSEACTILQWTDWAVGWSGEVFDFQALVYHGSFQIVYQIRLGTSALGEGTIGIQNRGATEASQYGFAEAGLVADTAVCFFDPRYPAGGRIADLSIVKSDKVDGVGPGAQVTYAVSVYNEGPSPAYGAEVRDTLPPTLLNCTWICESSEGSSCTAAGSGDIDESADIEPRGWVDFWLTCQVALSRGEVVNAATVTAPPDVLDPVVANNASIDVNRVLSGPLVCRTPLTRGELVLPARRSDESSLACPSRETERGAKRAAGR